MYISSILLPEISSCFHPRLHAPSALFYGHSGIIHGRPEEKQASGCLVQARARIQGIQSAPARTKRTSRYARLGDGYMVLATRALLTTPMFFSEQILRAPGGSRVNGFGEIRGIPLRWS